MVGTEKQIAWAKDIEAKYNHFVDTFGGEKIKCNDAKFWIDHVAQVNNVTFGVVPTRFEAYSFIRSGKYIDDRVLRQQSMDGLISRDAAILIMQGEIK